MTLRVPLSAYSYITSYPFSDETGRLVFEKRRYELLEPIASVRRKTFRYWDVETKTMRKPRGADGLIYRLPQVLDAVVSGETIHWSEGERDADALVAAGVCATSHHQGAGHVTLEQARWLRGARRVVLWVDKDRPDYSVGAFDASLRHDLLVEAGIQSWRIRVVRARGRGKDASDHLAAGYKLDRAVPVDKRKLAAVAGGYTSTIALRSGYRP